MNPATRDRVRWIAYGVFTRVVGAFHGIPVYYVWTIEQVYDGFVCVCYDDTERGGIAVNGSDSQLTCKRMAQDEAADYALHWIPVNARCNRHRHHTGPHEHLHWDKTDSVCSEPVGFASWATR